MHALLSLTSIESPWLGHVFCVDSNPNPVLFCRPVALRQALARLFHIGLHFLNQNRASLVIRSLRQLFICPESALSE